MKLIVGLGNPGDKYKKTRHNIGFEIIDQYVSSNNIGNFSYDNKYGWEVCVGEIPLNPPSQRGTEKVYFLKPMEYMNRSWQAVQKLMNFYKIEARDLLVLHDDIDLWTGIVKLKLDWGLAWHNWLKDIAEKLWTKEFHRIRIWVDRPLSADHLSDYVLSNFKKDEIEKIQDKYLDVEWLIKEFLEK